jgi:hypothetical protein
LEWLEKVAKVLPRRLLLLNPKGEITVYAEQSVYEHHQKFIEQSEAEPQTERTFVRKDKAAYRSYLTFGHENEEVYTLLKKKKSKTILCRQVKKRQTAHLV